MSKIEEAPSKLSRVKSAACIAQSVATVIAIIVAGIWFVERRAASLKANIDHTVIHRQISDKQTWVRVSIKITNIGNRLLDLKSGTFAIHQVLPYESNNNLKTKDYIVEWPVITADENRELNIKLEPGEVDHLDHEFIIPSNVETVEIYSSFNNPNVTGFAWTKSTIYNLE